ncbi:MAG: DUF6325 family protein [Mycetocola sp.]
MSLGPIEILVLGFPDDHSAGRILPELERLVEDKTVTVVDGLFVTIDDDGSPRTVEFDELDADSAVAILRSLLGAAEELLSDQDVAELVTELEPGSSVAILVVEHTWLKSLRDTVTDAGGVLLDSIRIPDETVADVQAAVAALA